MFRLFASQIKSMLTADFEYFSEFSEGDDLVLFSESILLFCSWTCKKEVPLKTYLLLNNFVPFCPAFTYLFFN